MLNFVKYGWNLLKIKYYDYMIEDSAGCPDSIESYSVSMKRTAENLLSRVKSPKRKSFLTEVIKEAEQSFAMSEY